MRIHRCAIVLVGFLLAPQPFLAANDAEERRANRLAEMRRRAEALKLELGQDAADQPRVIKLRPEPLLRFDDPTRDFYDGTLWAWIERGRPHALVSVERYEKVWAYELISLTSDPLSLKTPLGKTWRPTDATFTEKTIDGAKPSETPQGRRQQAKQLSRDFEMAEFIGANDARTMLRLFPRPIYEYEDEESSLLSGSMFVFANGTNPEILLLLEAHQRKGGEKVWQYGCAPLSTARVEAKLGGLTVWEAEKQRIYDFAKPYVAFGVPLSQDLESAAKNLPR